MQIEKLLCPNDLLCLCFRRQWIQKCKIVCTRAVCVCSVLPLDFCCCLSPSCALHREAVVNLAQNYSHALVWVSGLSHVVVWLPFSVLLFIQKICGKCSRNELMFWLETVCRYTSIHLLATNNEYLFNNKRTMQQQMLSITKRVSV